MSKEIQKLINKKKLTGAEVGKLFIKDTLAAWGAGSKDPNFKKLDDYPGIFTQAEREAMVAKLTGEKNLQDYNTYRDIHTALLKIPMRFSMYKESTENYFWRGYIFLEKAINAEEENRVRRCDPYIMTQKQYDALLKQAHDEAITKSDSIEGLFFHVLGLYLSMYKEGKRTPHNKHFAAAKKKKITNPRIRENYWEAGANGHYVTPEGKTNKEMTGEEWTAELNRWRADKKLTDPDPIMWIDDGTAAPDTATMFDVLEEAFIYYSWVENENEAYFAEFAADFPGLYKDLMHEITHLKGLEFLTGRTDFFNAALIPCRIMYENDHYDYRKMIDNPERFCSGGIGRGIAILHPDHLPSYSFGATIDENGYFNQATQYLSNQIETINEDFGEGILLLLERMRNSLEEYHATKEAVKLIAERIDVPELGGLLDQFQQISPTIFDLMKDQSKRLADIIERYDPCGLYLDKTATRKARAMARKLFHPLQLNDGKPTPENIKRAREYISNIHNIYEHTETIYSILRGAAHDEEQR